MRFTAFAGISSTKSTISSMASSARIGASSLSVMVARKADCLLLESCANTFAARFLGSILNSNNACAGDCMSKTCATSTSFISFRFAISGT